MSNHDKDKDSNLGSASQGANTASGVNPAPAATPPVTGDFVGQAPHPPGSVFRGERKMPGWRPDMTTANFEYLFPEEAIFRDNQRKFHAFPPPTHPDASLPADKRPFKDPEPNDPDAIKRKFNEWILGVPFVNTDDKKNTEFDKVVKELLRLARNYNAALYWMRQLHFHEKKSQEIGTAPPPNANGDLGPLPTTPDEHLNAVKAAQARWKVVVNELNALLAGGGHKFKSFFVDFVQVNDYIVSARIVGDERVPDNIAVEELGGSSSSHISISSAFSSEEP